MLTSYIELGFEHILDVKGYDHILFVIVLCVAYKSTEWRKMLVLITAFTLGHTLTLGLSASGLISINSILVETLIPITILLSALLNIWEEVRGKLVALGVHYFLALAFGLIHGLGFSNFFKSLVSPGESIFPMLLSFNVGVELGQIIVVLLTFLLIYVLVQFFKIVRHSIINITVSALAGVISILLLAGVL